MARRRRWIWLLGGSLVLAGLGYGAARFADEPVRRYMEAEVNRRLTGYTVRVLPAHPLLASSAELGKVVLAG